MKLAVCAVNNGSIGRLARWSPAALTGRSARRVCRDEFIRERNGCHSRLYTALSNGIRSQSRLAGSVHHGCRSRFYTVSSSTVQSKSRLAGSVHHGSTIYALSSAPGRAAIAVIRISGPACLQIYKQLCPGKDPPKPRVATVRALYSPGEAPTRESILDSSALILYFPGPNTVTGEDVLELHVHGGPAIVKAVLRAISKCRSDESGQIRYAEPGEFTRRAFLNNRLDLVQAEALGDTLSADTEQQRRLSVRGTTGALANQYEQWRRQLLYARGELEALIDFSEDQHFDESQDKLMVSVAEQVKVLRQAMHIHIRNGVRGELLRHGITVSLLGAPNAGKSSLLNRIVGREAAIVSSEAGTTRDIVEVGVDLGGYFCRFGDTAGLRQALQTQFEGQVPAAEKIGRIEEEGMRRAKARAEESDVVVVVLSLETDRNGAAFVDFDPEVCFVAQRLVVEKDNVVVVINKSDLIREWDSYALNLAVQQTLQQFPGLQQESIHILSCIDGTTDNLARSSAGNGDPGGIQTFLQGLIGQFTKMTAAIVPEGADSTAAGSDADPSIWQESLGASERHRVLLHRCIIHLDEFLCNTKAASRNDDGSIKIIQNPDLGPQKKVQRRCKTYEGLKDQLDDKLVEERTYERDDHWEENNFEDHDEGDIVIAAEELRNAAECLAKITGRGEAGDVEEVLGVVFEKFCVGK